MLIVDLKKWVDKKTHYRSDILKGGGRKLIGSWDAKLSSYFLECLFLTYFGWNFEKMTYAGRRSIGSCILCYNCGK